MTADLKLGTTDRVTLYMALVPYLMDHSPVSVTEAAQVFRVAPGEMRDLIAKLANLGVPGSEGYYLPHDLFEINYDLFEADDVIDLIQAVGIDAAPKLSGTEAATLVAGLQFISGLIAPGERDALETLSAKIALGASSQPSNIIVSTPESPVDLAVIRNAHAEGVQLRFLYRNARGSNDERNVTPLRLDLVGVTWYLRAWCHLRDALRTFRLDRMSELTATEERASSKLGDEALPDALFDEQDTDIAVTLELAESALPLISAYVPDVIAAVSTAKLHVRVRFATLAQLERLVASLPGVITVVEPAEAVRRVGRFAQEALDRYALPPSILPVVSQLSR